MSKIIENVTKALQSIDMADQDLKGAYRGATALECIALDRIKAAVFAARCDTDRLLHAIRGPEREE